MEWALSAQPVTDLRIKALEQSDGRVLELGFGTGLNIACYPYTINELVAVDAEMMMNGRVQDRISKSPFPVRRIFLDASRGLPLEDQSFDTVVTTFWNTVAAPTAIGAGFRTSSIQSKMSSHQDVI